MSAWTTLGDGSTSSGEALGNGAKRERTIASDEVLAQALGVSRTSFVSYRQQCHVEAKRLRDCADAIMIRPMHAALSEMVETFESILRNIDSDPNDIRVENALPNIMRRAATSAEEYVRMASEFEPPLSVQERMRGIEAMTAEGARWLGKVLQQMKSNDGQGIEAKVQILSSVFRDDSSRFENLNEIDSKPADTP